jgi:hypothetical protein
MLCVLLPCKVSSWLLLLLLFVVCLGKTWSVVLPLLLVGGLLLLLHRLEAGRGSLSALDEDEELEAEDLTLETRMSRSCC